MQTSPAPAVVVGGAYQSVVLHADITYVGGQLPRRHGELRWTGKVGSELDLEQARQTARPYAARCLLALGETLGGLRRAGRLLKATGYITNVAGFVRQSAVINAASEYFDEVLDARGGHARATIDVAELLYSAAVEVELIAAVRS